MKALNTLLLMSSSACEGNRGGPDVRAYVGGEVGIRRAVETKGVTTDEMDNP